MLFAAGLISVFYALQPDPRTTLLRHLSTTPYVEESTLPLTPNSAFPRTVRLGDPTLTLGPNGLPARPASNILLPTTNVSSDGDTTP